MGGEGRERRLEAWEGSAQTGQLSEAWSCIGRQCYQFSRLPKRSTSNWLPSATEMCFLIVLGASNSRPRCQMVCFLLDKCETESAPGLSPGCRWWAGHLWRSLASRSIIPISAFIFTEPPLCVCESLLPNFPLLEGPSDTGLGAHPNPV